MFQLIHYRVAQVRNELIFKDVSLKEINIEVQVHMSYEFCV